MDWIERNLKQLQSDVRQAARDCGRDPDQTRILAVSKTFPAEAVRQAVRAGQLRFGENRVQEARDKVPEVGLPELEWHLIGHLQSNKVRQAVQVFDVIQTVDSIALAERIDRVCAELDRTMPVLIEVNLGGELQKAGVDPAELGSLAERIDQLERLVLQGLMAIPPYDPDPEASRPYFRRLANLLAELNRGRSQPLTELSMGMSGDFPVAIQEGATLIRIGTAIFGERR